MATEYMPEERVEGEYLAYGYHRVKIKMNAFPHGSGELLFAHETWGWQCRDCGKAWNLTPSAFDEMRRDLQCSPSIGRQDSEAIGVRN